MGLREWLPDWLRRPSDEEMRAELETHVAMRAEYDASDAGAARRRLGGELRTREEMQDVWRRAWLEAAGQDVRFTLQTWRRHPGFAVAAVATLALGLGAAAGMFSMVDRILFRPLPYPDGERIVSVGLMAPLDANEFLLSPDYLTLWRETPRAFSAVTTLTAGTSECDLTEHQPERLRCAPVEWNLLRVLRVAPAAGRDFRKEESEAGVAKSALISHALWMRRFGGDRSIEGKKLNIDGEPVEVAGVLPSGFELPTMAQADVLFPQRLAQPVEGRPAPMTVLRGYARLRDGVTAEQAHGSLQGLFVEMLKNVPPAFRKEVTLRVRSLRDRQVGDARQAAWLLLGAVGALLLIACVNVANLLAARMASRKQELAVRSSLGASRGRLGALVMTESLLLAVLGGVLGLGVAHVLVRVFAAMAPAGIPKLAEASVDGRAVAAAAAMALASAVLIGLWPALRAARMRVAHGARTTEGLRPWARFAMVAAQIALTFTLLGGCTLLLRSLWNLQSVALGFETESVLTAQVTLPVAKYRSPELQLAFFEQLLERAARAPGVRAVALSDSLPPVGAVRSMIYSRIDVKGRPPAAGGTGGMVSWRLVTPGYLDALRIPVLQGRRFTAEDAKAADPAMILSEKLARRMFPQGDAVGQRLRPGGEGQPWHVVVGVSKDVRNVGPAAEAEPEYFVARRAVARDAVRRSFLVVRTAGVSNAAVTASLRAEVANVDAALPVAFETMSERAGMLAARPRFLAWLLTAFAGLALALASMGLAGVASYLVTQRTRDIGVRMALGATPGAIRAGVLGEAARWIVAGAVAGVAMAWGAARFLATMLHGVETADPLSWAAVVLVLAGVLTLAVVHPAWRAARVDPGRALRAE